MTKSGSAGNPPVPPRRQSSPPGGQQLDDDSSVLMMDLSSSLKLERDSVIETDRGLRLKLDYGNSGKAKYHSPADGLIEGTIASGSDWVTVRRDGVVEFDSRITLQFEMVKGDGDHLYLIDGTFRGMLDLEHPNATSDDEIFSDFIRGARAVPGFGVTLSARFEGSSGPPLGGDASWIPKRLQNAARHFKVFRPLVREQFVAYGQVLVEQAPYYPPRHLSLKVWTVPAPSVSTDQGGSGDANSATNVAHMKRKNQ